MAKLICLLVLAFVAYVAAYPSPQDSVIQSLPGRVKRAPGPEHLHHYETTRQDRFGNIEWSHEDAIHSDPHDHFHGGFNHGHHHSYDGHHHHSYDGHHHHYPHYGGHGFLGGIFDFFG